MSPIVLAALALHTSLWTSASTPLKPGLQLSTQGELRPVAGDRTGPVVKRFRCQFTLLRGSSDAGYEILWMVQDELGEPRWSWEQRFGRCWVNPDLVIPPDRFGPAILGQHQTTSHRIPIRFPVLPHELLQNPTTFRQFGLEYSPAGLETIAGKRLLRLEGSTNLAVRELLWVDPETGFIHRFLRRLTMGQGVPYQLTYTLQRVQELDPAQLAELRELVEALEKARGEEPKELSRPAAGAATPEKLTAVKKLADQARALGDPILNSVVQQAAEELTQHLTAQAAVEKLAAQVLGKPAADFELRDLRGRTVRLRDLRGRTVVLHFWSYGDEVLEAPYGEVGYLDYIVRRFREKGVVVLGIATQEDLLDATRRPRAVRRIRQFTRFMNLSYPVLLDDLGVIDRFGDPRRVRGKLPLYIVIDRNGVVRSYHAGFWAEAPDQGLVKLETILSGLAR